MAGKKKMGRPKKGMDDIKDAVITYRCNHSMRDYADRLCKKLGMTRSEFMSKAMLEFGKNHSDLFRDDDQYEAEIDYNNPDFYYSDPDEY